MNLTTGRTVDRDATGLGPLDRFSSCARCGTDDVAELTASDGVVVAVKCGRCGHVFSLTALRGLAARMGEDSPERIVYQLQFLAGHRRDYVLVDLDLNLDAFDRVFGGESK